MNYQSWGSVYDLDIVPFVSTTTTRRYANDDGTETRVTGFGFNTDPLDFLDTGTITGLSRFDPSTGKTLISFTGARVDVASELNPHFAASQRAEAALLPLLDLLTFEDGFDRETFADRSIKVVDENGRTLQFVGRGLDLDGRSAAATGVVTEIRVLRPDGTQLATSGPVNFTILELESSIDDSEPQDVFGNFISQDASTIFVDPSYGLASDFEPILEYLVLGGPKRFDLSSQDFSVVDYGFSTTGLVADLADGTVAREGVVDTFTGTGPGTYLLAGSYYDDDITAGGLFDFIDGSGGNDTLDASDVGSLVVGGTGNDRVYGGAAPDSLYGGDFDEDNGFRDTLDYSRSTAGVTVDLSTGAASGGFAQNDFIDGFEHLVGSTRADTLSGNALGNILEGGGGSDVLSGRQGNDVLVGGTGRDILFGASGNDFLVGDVTRDASDTAGGQVYRIYQATLDRAPDTAGYGVWVDRIESGARSVQEVVSGFVASGEFQRVYGTVTDRQFVTLLYNNVLDRAPDTAGLNGWLATLSNGTSRENVVIGFSESAEFKAGTSIEAGAYAGALSTRAQSDFLDDVFRLYGATLDRAPDAGGLESWSGRLADGQSYVSVASGFTNSTEFVRTYGDLDDRGFVNQLYRNVLDREGDSAGVAGWQARLDGGSSREEVVRGFAQSRENIEKTAGAFDAYITARGGDRLDGGSGNDTLAGGYTADIFQFDADEDGVDVVLQIDPWDTLRFRDFGYDTASDALAKMRDTASDALAKMRDTGADVRFEDQGVTIVFSDTDLATLAQADYLFA